MRLDVLLSGIGYPVGNADPSSDVTKVTAFAENCDQQSVFIALHGFDETGNISVDIAVSHGAKAIVTEEGVSVRHDKQIPIVVVPDIRAAYSRLCDRLCFSPGKRLELYAVTGTNGKTSVAWLLSRILARKSKTEVIGTVWNDMTTPDPEILYPLLKSYADSGVKNVVLEASSHALKLKKLLPLRFRVGIFTNLTRDHGDFHKTVEDYYLSKASLFRLCDNAVINLDDRFGRRLFEECPCENRFGYSLSDETADFFAKDLSITDESLKYELVTGNGSIPLVSRMPWSFNACNTLAAAGAAYTVGINKRKIQSGIYSVDSIPGRLEKIKCDTCAAKHPEIYIDYAHTPDALKNAIGALRRVYGNKRLVVMFGCGGERDREKRPVMGKIATGLADFTVITTDNSRSENPTLIIRDIIAQIPPDSAYVVIKDRREAIMFALDEAGNDDILLIAGKGHEKYIIENDGRRFFDEKEIIREYLRIQ